MKIVNVFYSTEGICVDSDYQFPMEQNYVGILS